MLTGPRCNTSSSSRLNAPLKGKPLPSSSIEISMPPALLATATATREALECFCTLCSASRTI